MTFPADVGLERQTLGVCFLRPSNIDTIRGITEAGDFSLNAHQIIWRAICELYDKGKPADRISVFQEIQDRGGSSEIDPSFLFDLDTGVPDVTSVESYAERLHVLAIRRRLMAAADILLNRAADRSEDVYGTIADFSDTLISLSRASEYSRPVSTADLLAEKGISGILTTRREHGLKLPWPKLDRSLSGLAPGQMIVLMAATSRGKTSMALQVAASVALQGGTPVIWTMEMSPLSNYQRMVSQLSGCAVGKYLLSYEARQAQGEACVKIGEHPIYFDQNSSSVGAFMASLRQIRSRAGLGLAIVDHLQLIRPGQSRNRAQEVSDNSRALKRAAMDMQVPFLVLSQVDRSSVKGDGEISLHSGKESGDIENDADVVMWINAGELSRDQDTSVSVHVGKQREGPAGFSIPMKFQPQSQTFVEYEGADDA